MERMDRTNIDPIVWFIHEHRYRWARQFTSGRVLDVACGIGYGSAVLRKNTGVTEYVGMDCSEDALAEARAEFSAEGVHFAKGDATSLPFPDGTFDTVVSLETIEHLARPEDAVKEFARILRPDGCLIGSVPTRAYEELAASIHGENPYHLYIFDLDEIQALLARHFDQVHFFAATVDVVTRIVSMESETSGRELRRRDESADGGPVCGSYMFVARKNASETGRSVAEDSLMLGLNLLEYDQIRLGRLNDIIKNKNECIAEKDQYIKQLESSLVSANMSLKSPIALAKSLVKNMLGR